MIHTQGEPLMYYDPLIWVGCSGALPNVQHVAPDHAPDVRSTSNTVFTSFCQGKRLKTKQIIGYINSPPARQKPEHSLY